jgi:esterase/lipase
VLELEKVQNAMEKSLKGIRTPVLLIQSRKDLSEESVAHITTKLTNTTYESIWHDDFDHSMVLDKQRKQVFEEIHQYIHKTTKK